MTKVVRQFRKLAPKNLIFFFLFFFFNDVSFWLVELSAAVLSTYASGQEEREHVAGSMRRDPETLSRAGSMALGSWDLVGRHRARQAPPVRFCRALQKFKRGESWKPPWLFQRHDVKYRVFSAIIPFSSAVPNTVRAIPDPAVVWERFPGCIFNNLLYIAATNWGTYLICDLTVPVKQTVTLLDSYYPLPNFHFY